jgi:hypothetical protein
MARGRASPGSSRSFRNGSALVGLHDPDRGVCAARDADGGEALAVWSPRQEPVGQGRAIGQRRVQCLAAAIHELQVGRTSIFRPRATGTDTSACRYPMYVLTSFRPSADRRGSAYSPMPVVSRCGSLSSHQRVHQLTQEEGNRDPLNSLLIERINRAEDPTLRRSRSHYPATPRR